MACWLPFGQSAEAPYCEGTPCRLRTRRFNRVQLIAPTDVVAGDRFDVAVVAIGGEGDVDEHDEREILMQAMLVKNESRNKWDLYVDFATEGDKEEEKWDVDVLCFKDEPAGLYQRGPFHEGSTDIYPRDNSIVSTGISLDEYICFVAGMEATDGELETGEELVEDIPHPLIVQLYWYDNIWRVQADIATELDKPETWRAKYLCVTREIAWHGLLPDLIQ